MADDRSSHADHPHVVPAVGTAGNDATTPVRGAVPGDGHVRAVRAGGGDHGREHEHADVEW
jgi:hypothetical protein